MADPAQAETTGSRSTPPQELRGHGSVSGEGGASANGMPVAVRTEVPEPAKISFPRL